MSSFEYLFREWQKRWKAMGLTPGVSINFGDRELSACLHLSIFRAGLVYWSNLLMGKFNDSVQALSRSGAVGTPR
jgi:hypothetical protein